MARPPRPQFEGACYHVYHRGNRRERIFYTDADYAQFESYMIEAMNWSGVTLLDWSLMPNHFHFLLETPDGNLAEFMQRLLTRYAKYFNWTHKKVGHVFQGRYQSRVCDKESYLRELIRYVELNPYRLVNGMLAKVGEWKWSSFRYLMGLEEAPEGLEKAHADVLGRFGSDLKSAREGLATFLADGLLEGNWEDFYKMGTDRFLGNEEFIERVKRVMGEPVRSERRALLKVSNAVELMAKVEACFGMAGEEIVRPGKERGLSRIRKAFVEVGRQRYRFPVLDLAKVLKRSESAISMMMKRQWQKKTALAESRTLVEFLDVKGETDGPAPWS